MQEAPSFQHPFKSDAYLQNFLKNSLPQKFHESIFKDLEKFDHRAQTDVLEMAREDVHTKFMTDKIQSKLQRLMESFVHKNMGPDIWNFKDSRYFNEV